jgi:hypothetical protein
MTPAKRQRAARGERTLIDALEPIEAKRLLGSLLDTRPDLVPEVAALADAKLGEVSVESVAEKVAWAIGELQVEDVWDGSCSQPDGSYVDPTEAAYAVVDDALVPFVQDLERRIRLGREDEAAGVCQGILLGLYQVTVQCRDRGNEFLDGYAPDAIEEAAGFVLESWKKTGGRADPRLSRSWAGMRKFASEDLHGWRSSLLQILDLSPKTRSQP